MGTSDDLTPERLAEAAAALAARVAGAAGPAGQAASARGGPPGHIGQDTAGIPLLATKLFAPRPRSDLVPRPRLLARLDAGLDAALFGLLARLRDLGATLLLVERLTDAAT